MMSWIWAGDVIVGPEFREQTTPLALPGELSRRPVFPTHFLETSATLKADGAVDSKLSWSAGSDIKTGCSAPA